MNVEQLLVEQLVKDIKELVKARTSEEVLEKSVIEKLGEKFSELVKQLVEVERSER